MDAVFLANPLQNIKNRFSFVEGNRSGLQNDAVRRYHLQLLRVQIGQVVENGGALDGEGAGEAFAFVNILILRLHRHWLSFRDRVGQIFVLPCSFPIGIDSVGSFHHTRQVIVCIAAAGGRSRRFCFRRHSLLAGIDPVGSFRHTRQVIVRIAAAGGRSRRFCFRRHSRLEHVLLRGHCIRADNPVPHPFRQREV